MGGYLIAQAELSFPEKSHTNSQHVLHVDLRVIEKSSFSETCGYTSVQRLMLTFNCCCLYGPTAC